MKRLLFLLALVLAIPSAASAQYYVKPGDSLWKIARSQGMTLSALRGLNPHITRPDLIHPGDYIITRSTNTAQDLTEYARSLQDLTRYVYGGSRAPYQTDCSGWVQHVYAKFGVTLPRVSRDQARAGQPVSFREMQQGDLMFFSNRADQTITHVGIYLGGDYWISNLNSRESVKVLSTWGAYTQKQFLFARRVL
jgi:hypothetical protein